MDKGFLETGHALSLQFEKPANNTLMFKTCAFK